MFDDGPPAQARHTPRRRRINRLIRAIIPWLSEEPIEGDLDDETKAEELAERYVSLKPAYHEEEEEHWCGSCQKARQIRGIEGEGVT